MPKKKNVIPADKIFITKELSHHADRLQTLAYKMYKGDVTLRPLADTVMGMAGLCDTITTGILENFSESELNTVCSYNNRLETGEISL